MEGRCGKEKVPYKEILGRRTRRSKWLNGSLGDDRGAEEEGRALPPSAECISSSKGSRENLCFEILRRTGEVTSASRLSGKEDRRPFKNSQQKELTVLFIHCIILKQKAHQGSSR